MARVLDYILITFFLVHIPITLLFGVQVMLGPALSSQLMPKGALIVLKQAVASSNDPLLAMALPNAVREPWAIAIFYAEVLFQLPLFACLSYGLWKSELLFSHLACIASPCMKDERIKILNIGKTNRLNINTLSRPLSDLCLAHNHDSDSNSN